jgi:hypothetical protein
MLWGVMFIAASGFSQEPVGRDVQGYAFFAPGLRPSDGTATFSFGGGMDFLVGSAFSVGADAHFFGWWDCSSCGAFILSGNAGYLRRRRSAEDDWEPFARIGVGAAAAEGGGIGVAAFSGGANYWFREHLALRVEGRYEYVFDEEGYVHFRVGVTF